MMERREFLKYAAGGLSALVVGDMIPGLMENEAFSQVRAGIQTINFTITDAVKDMATNNAINVAQCYFWIYKATVTTTAEVTEDIPPRLSGTEHFLHHW
jgi:hypothetical protein